MRNGAEDGIEHAVGVTIVGCQVIRNGIGLQIVVAETEIIYSLAFVIEDINILHSLDDIGFTMAYEQISAASCRWAVYCIVYVGILAHFNTTRVQN